MNAAATENLPPVQETVAHKTDVLDWSQMTTRACDLEFRDSVTIGFGESLSIGFQLSLWAALASLGGWLIAWLTGAWFAESMIRLDIATLVGVVGVAWSTLYASRRLDMSDDLGSLLTDLGLWGRAFLPTLAWQAVTLTAKLDAPLGGFCFYVLVTLPAAVWFFDRFATHAIYWYTASPTTDHASKCAGRTVWAGRFQACSEKNATAERECGSAALLDEILRATHGYRWGALWVLLAFLVPALVVTLTSPLGAVSTVGLQLVIGSHCGLLFAVTLCCGADLRVFSRFFTMLVFWLCYGRGERLVPWLFQSPSGNSFGRGLFALVVIALVAIPLMSLAAHSYASLSADSAVFAADNLSANPPADNHDSWQALITPGIALATSSWIWIAPTVLTAFVVPAAHFYLLGVVLTGRVLMAYDNAFEAPQQGENVE